MPRRPRVHRDGVPLHIVQRGYTREPCFFGEEDDQSYRYWLGEALKKESCALHAYALMTNPVHLLITPERAETIPRLLIALGRRYVQYHPLAPHWHLVGQPLPILVDPGRNLPAELPTHYRAQPRACRQGGRPRPLPLDPLASQRAWTGPFLSEPARALSGDRPGRRREAGG